MHDNIIKAVSVSAAQIATDRPEADGTLFWDHTTIVIVEIKAATEIGIGYTYADQSIVSLIEKVLAPRVVGLRAFDIPAISAILWDAVRNLGRSGLAACAISAIDIGLWDLKARLLNLPLATLLGQSRNLITTYGSGGFTCYDGDVLQKQLSSWVNDDGCRAVKMKIGSVPEDDPGRVRLAREAIGDAALYVDANGAFTPRGALRVADRLSEHSISWFEEPVSSDDREGMAFVRDRIGTMIDVAAGEYSYTVDDTRMMLQAHATDVQQVDVTRVGGITGFIQAASLCDAFHVDLSAHCAPSAHLHAACAVKRFRNLEWFHDHVRIERMLFEGVPVPKNGMIAPDLSQPGHGLTLKAQEVAHYAI